MELHYFTVFAKKTGWVGQYRGLPPVQATPSPGPGAARHVVRGYSRASCAEARTEGAACRRRARCLCKHEVQTTNTAASSMYLMTSDRSVMWV